MRGLAALGVSSLGLTALCYWLFYALDFWVPPVTFVFGTATLYTCNVVLQHLAESRQKRWLRSAFNRYVSPAVVESIVNNPGSLELGGQEIQATIFFSDLANFTSFSEHLPPKDLVTFLNEYFTPMTNIILEHRGGLDKFIGDAVMAFWGAPLPLENHAQYACEAALKMKETMAGLREGWRQRRLPLLEARMGIHSGPVVAGNVGSRERFNYTVLGDTVNLASRLEGANKFYGTSILISEDAVQLAGPSFLMRELDLIRVKGRQAPVKIYELIGKRGERGASVPGCFCKRFGGVQESALGPCGTALRVDRLAGPAFENVPGTVPSLQDRSTTGELGRGIYSKNEVETQGNRHQQGIDYEADPSADKTPARKYSGLAHTEYDYRTRFS